MDGDSSKFLETYFLSYSYGVVNYMRERGTKSLMYVVSMYFFVYGY
jgi:hypothetical protein